MARRLYMANSAKIKKYVKSKQVISALDSVKSLRLSRSLLHPVRWELILSCSFDDSVGSNQQQDSEIK